jgi:hypothetical protein
VHVPPRMKRMLILGTVVLLVACGESGATVEGVLLGEGRTAAVRDAWVIGREGREEVSDGRFVLRDVPPGVVDLRLGDNRGEAARLLIHGLPAGAHLSLHDLRLERGTRLVFPSRIDLDGARTVTINGIRMAPPGSVSGRLREQGVLLAVSGAADALLVRPLNERLPDLRVVVTPTTDVTTPDGDPADAELLSAGDTVQVEGAAEQGYLVATRIVAPRSSVLRSAADEEEDAAPARAARPAPSRSTPATRATAEPRSAPAPRAAERPRPEPAPPAEARRGPPAEPPGRGRGQERGRGRGRD